MNAALVCLLLVRNNTVDIVKEKPKMDVIVINVVGMASFCSASGLGTLVFR